MELQLEGKKVIISGGAKGIGASIVKSFANAWRNFKHNHGISNLADCVQRPATGY